MITIDFINNFNVNLPEIKKCMIDIKKRTGQQEIILLILNKNEKENKNQFLN